MIYECSSVQYILLSWIKYYIKKIKMKNIFLAMFIASISLVSCKKEELNPNPTVPIAPVIVNYTTLGTDTTANNEIVTLYSLTSEIKTGYNKTFITVKDLSGIAITNATVVFEPLMDMGMMQHASPVENPIYNSDIEKYEGVVIYTMSSLSGVWTLGVNVNGSSVSFGITVLESPTQVVRSFTGTDGEIYIITLVPPSTWNVGMNELEIMINKKTSMMSFPADNDFTAVLTPEMVSMAHGSPNNISPVLVGNGHYKGTVNLTMTGDWRLHLELSKAGVIINTDAYLDILF